MTTGLGGSLLRFVSRMRRSASLASTKRPSSTRNLTNKVSRWILFVVLFRIGTLTVLVHRSANIQPISLELSHASSRYTIDSDLTTGNIPLSSLSNFQIQEKSANGLFLSADCTTIGSILLHIPAPYIISEYPDTDLSNPRLVELARALDMHNSVLPATELQLPVSLPPNLASRSVSRSILRACGFKSRFQAQNSAVRAHAIAIPDRVHMAHVLNASSTSAYDWHAIQPTAADCRRTVQSGRKHHAKCRRLLEILLIVYLGGCTSISDVDLYQTNEREELMLGLPRGCFSESSAWKLSRDIFLSYLREMCQLPAGGLARIRSLSAISWGVGRRASALLRDVERSEVCTKKWSFYSIG